MRATRYFPLLTALLTLTAACTVDGDEPGDDITDDSDIKKRTKPKAGMGAIVLEKPAWFDESTFKGAVKVMTTSGDRTLTPNAQLDLPPGDYKVYFRPEGMMTGLQSSSSGSWSTVGHFWRKSGNLAVGAVWSVNPAGLRVELDRPLVWHRPVVLGSVAVPDPGVVHFANSYGGTATQTQMRVNAIDTLTMSSERIAAGAKTVDMLLPAETYEVSIGRKETPVLLEGKLTTLPLATVSIAIDLDAIDPAFPDSTSSVCVKLEAEGATEQVRALDKFKTAILPEPFPVTLKAFGVAVPSTVAGGVRRFTLNRLELDDVEVTAAGGATTKVKGQVRLEMKTASGWSPLSCGVPITTSTGIDLPDGTYRITSTATGPTGPVSHTEEISFP